MYEDNKKLEQQLNKDNEKKAKEILNNKEEPTMQDFEFHDDYDVNPDEDF